MKNILHISDFHLSDGPNGLSPKVAKEVVGSLKKDVDEMSLEINGSVDTIFITGDLTFSGKKEDFEKFKSIVVDDLSGHFGLETDDIFIVPGNHDCDRGSISRTEKPFRDKQSFKEIDELCSDVQLEREGWPRIEAFYNWFDDNFRGNKNSIYNSKLTNIYKVSNNLFVVGLSSAWLAQDDEDEGKLVIGASQIKLMKEKVPKSATIVLLMHHPIDWLHPEEISRFSNFVEKRVCALFFGHMHEFGQSLEANFQYDITLKLQAGTFDSRHKSSGYSLVSLQKENDFSYGEVFYRKYNVLDRSFESWVERGENGRFSFSTVGDLTFDKGKFAKSSSLKLQELNDGLIVNLGVSKSSKKNISSLFVEPNLSKPHASGLIKCKSDFSKVSEIESYEGVCFVFAGQNEGKSFFIDYLLANGLERQSKRVFDKIVIKLDAEVGDLKGEAKILKKLSGFYFDDDISTSFESFVKRSIKAGNATILIDNICRSKFKSEIFEFVESFSGCGFIFACSASSEMELLEDIRGFERNDVALVGLGGAKRKNVRQMISNWTALSPIGSEKAIYDSLMGVINKSQLPHNNFIYSMLLAIYENEKELSKIFNESDIIENFIEILLRKHNMNTPADKPQYKDLLRFMAFLAKHAILDSMYVFSKNDLVDVARDYNKKTFHDFSYEDYFYPLINSGILKKSEGGFVFSQSCFMNYAAAYYMSMDSNFKDHVVNDLNYLKYNGIIEYFACQNPSNQEVLQFVADRVVELRCDISKLMLEKYSVDVESIDYENIDDLSVLDLAASSDDFESQLSSVKADREKNDEIMDEIAPLKSNRGAADSSAHAIDLDAQTTISNSESKLREAVSLYGRVHRNMEALIDSRLVIEHFGYLIDSYLYLVKFNLARMDDNILIPLIVPMLDDYFKSENDESKSKAEHISAIKGLISLVRSIVPSMVQAQMTEDLSSKKPRIVKIINTYSEECDDELSAVMLKYVLMDLEKFDFKKDLWPIAKSKSKLVKNTIFFKLVQILMLDHELNSSDRKVIEKFVRKLVEKNRDIYRDVSTVKSLKTFNTVLG